MTTMPHREKHLFKSIITCEEKFCKEINNAIIMKSSSDEGVRRNFGRSGCAMGPQVIINTLKKMNNHFNKDFKIVEKEMTSLLLEKEDFDKAQSLQSESIASLLSFKQKKYIHLGGGHDHVFPLLQALDAQQEYKNIVIINIDAHCDTRQDSISHSGTPFRDYDKISSKPFFLYQYGIHLESNNSDTIQELKKGQMNINSKKSSAKDVIEDINEKCPFPLNNESLVLLSIDCDGFDSSFMSAVSAVNSNGISLVHFLELLELIKKLPTQNTVLGIYEYNPIYEDLSLKGAKAIAKIIIEYLK